MPSGPVAGLLLLVVAAQTAGARACTPSSNTPPATPPAPSAELFFNPAIAPSGASFYRGQRFPRFANNLFVGALREMHLLRLTIDATRSITAQERLLADQFGRLRDVLSGPDGYLYFSTNNRDGRGSPTATDDRIVRLVPAP